MNVNFQQLWEDRINYPAIISNNLCKQLVSFQEYIFHREDCIVFPTEQEANTFTKLVNDLEKLKKMTIAAKANEAVNEFFSFIDKRWNPH